MMLRRSTKRCSSSSNSEVKHDENAASTSLKRKRRKLGIKTETDDIKSADNSKQNAFQSKVQPKVESSDSSSDEFVPAPPLSSFDLCKFPEKKELELSDFTAIENNILTGVARLSDSDDCDSDDCDFEGVSEDQSAYSRPVKRKENVTESAKTGGERMKTSNSCKSRIKSKMNIAEASSGGVNMESDGRKVLLAPDVNKMDVSELLALGESSRTISKVHTSVGDRTHDLTSDSENDLSEWENVEGLGVTPTENIIPKEGIEVTLEMPDLYRKRKKKGFDMEAHLRRRLNRVRRELQVLIHKVHLLCWIAHGQYINSVLNSEILMAQSLSLIPSQHCYPSKHTNLSYLEQIVTWFKKTVTITESKESGPLLPLCQSLQQSFQLRTACSARDLVLMFICILRALGVKARLIMSLQPLPLKPSNQDLCISNKMRKSDESQLKSSKYVKGEDTDMRDNSEAVTSKISFQEGNECLKANKSRSSTKLKDEGQVDDACTKKESKSKSDQNSKTRDSKLVKGHRSDADISDKKMDKLKRTLRARKEKINLYRDKSDSSDEADTSNRDTRVACEKKKRPNIRISSDRRHSKRSTTDVSLTEQQKTSSKATEDVKKIVKVKTNKGENLRQTASSTKEDENSDSDQSWNLKTIEPADSNSDSDFKLKKNTKKKKSLSGRLLERGELASDSGTSIDGEGTQKKKNRCDVWTEVFLEEEEKWISVDVQSGKVHCITQLHSRATQPVTYVLAFNNDLTLKDVTCRYCVHFSTLTRKLRVDERWWKESLSPFLTAPTPQDREEDEQLNQLMLDRPMPTTLKEFKNHPLYVLKDDLLKFEAIYPPNAPPLGFVKGKPIYARECVHVLHSREIWLKEAKVVRLGETPYKIVKARPKYDRMTGQFVKDLPLEVFGFWQVEDYVPPPAVNGKVPRNEYGNVELYKPCMLPKGTVHLQLPGLNRVARKLGIDCAPAVIGFDFHCGGSHPVLDGFIVCEEYQDTLLDAWNQEQEEAEKREQEKLEKRVYGNWRRLIKGLLIRERLKKRYSFGDEAGPSESKKINSKKLSGSGKKGKQKTVHERCKIQSKEEGSNDDDGK